MLGFPCFERLSHLREGCPLNSPGCDQRIDDIIEEVGQHRVRIIWLPDEFTGMHSEVEYVDAIGSDRF